jgi:hypothetical protein
MSYRHKISQLFSNLISYSAAESVNHPLMKAGNHAVRNADIESAESVKKPVNLSARQSVNQSFSQAMSHSLIVSY